MLPRHTQFAIALNEICENYKDVDRKDILRALKNKIDEIEKV